MSRKGDCRDNAVAESFFSDLKARVIEGRSFRDVRELRRVVFEYIEIHYARERKHSSNGWKTPQQYENEIAKKLRRSLNYEYIFSGQGQIKSKIATQKCYGCYRLILISASLRGLYFHQRC